MAGRKLIRPNQSRKRRNHPLPEAEMQPGMLARLPWVRPKRRRLAVWPPSVPSPAKSTASGGDWCGSPSPDFSAHGSSPSLNFPSPYAFRTSHHFQDRLPLGLCLGCRYKWQQKYRIWVDRTPSRVFVVYARCTHLGCTPDWKASENKFKCPCHGSGYDSEVSTLKVPHRAPWIARTWN